jgi:hypothetical protein
MYIEDPGSCPEALQELPCAAPSIASAKVNITQGKILLSLVTPNQWQRRSV